MFCSKNNIILVVLIFTYHFDNLKSQKIITLVENITSNEIVSNNNKINYIPIPTIDNRQEVLELNYSKPPDYTYIKDGEKKVVWLIKNKYETITITTIIKLYRYDLSQAIKKLNEEKSIISIDNKYLKPEKYIESDDKKIINQALTLKSNDIRTTVKNIFEFVVNHVTYKKFDRQKRGAKKTLKLQKGDCTEYSELMIALCRALDIPARIITGMIHHHNGKPGFHNWVEVHFKDLGWVPFDPTFADGDSIYSYDKLGNYYIYTSQTKNEHKSVEGHIYSTNSDGRDFINVEYLTHSDFDDKIARAIEFYNNNNSEQAIFLFDNLIIESPDNYLPLMYKGVLLARNKNFDKGLMHLQLAMKNTYNLKEKVDVIYAFANFYALQNDCKNATNYLEEVLKLRSNYKEIILDDKDFASIKGCDGFQQLLKEIK